MSTAVRRSAPRRREQHHPRLLRPGDAEVGVDHPNSTTNYILAYTDLKPGPVVLELPAAGPDGSLYGQVVDAWQMTIADIRPSGVDRGKGGKVLFTGPDFAGDVPEGYIQVKSPNYRIMLAFRSVRGPGKTEADAYAYAKRLRMYPLAEAANPPVQTFIDPVDMRYPTLPAGAPVGPAFGRMVDAWARGQDHHARPIRHQDRKPQGFLRSG